VNYRGGKKLLRTVRDFDHRRHSQVHSNSAVRVTICGNLSLSRASYGSLMAELSLIVLVSP